MLEFPTIYPVACHTDNVGPGSMFVAIKGHKEDGVKYIQTALHKGATTIVVEVGSYISDDCLHAIALANARLEIVENARAALAHLSAQALGNPASKLKILAITGTKGKTTSSFLLEHILKTAGYKTALLTTVKNRILEQEFKTDLTTKHPDYLHVFFDLCVKAGVEIVIMEVAAQATSLHRVDGLRFDGLIFTNFDQEHAEFYPTMADYFAAKCALFGHLKPGAPLLINCDDASCSKIVAQHPDTIGFSLKNQSCIYKANAQCNDLNAVSVSLEYHHELLEFSCPALVGAYNAYNILGVIALCLEIKIAPRLIAHGLTTFSRVPGRLERYVLPNGATCFIDYAHNPSSYEAVLSMARTLSSHLIVVFGCGGDRDKTKRPLMGQLAARYGDYVILTTDNPRSEDPAHILEDIKAGIAAELMHKVVCELDRELAIKKAYAMSHAGSVIMLLGKGPDEYQIFGTIKTYFSEAAILKSLTY